MKRGVTLRVLLAPLLMVTSLAGTRQDDTKESALRLAGNSQKEWILTRWDKYLRSKCKAGESWTFFADGRLLIQRCESDTVTNENKHWALESHPPLDIVVRVDDKEYRLLFPPTEGSSRKEQLILRHVSRQKTIRTTDMTFYHEVD